MEKLAHQILDKCKGLPLAIAAIGSLLATKPKTATEWRNLLDHIGSELERNPRLDAIRVVLSSSYDGLPYHDLKACFLYLSIFPEDRTIRKTRLVRRWIAEGYVRERRGMTAEDVAECCFNEFISRSMMEPSVMDKFLNREMIEPSSIVTNGRISGCRVHDLVLELMASKATAENLAFFLNEQCSVLPQEHGKTRHLVIASSWSREEQVLESMNLSHLRSLTAFGEFRPFLISPRMRLLRVLDLEGCYGVRDQDLNQICELLHLRYLGLRNTFILKLPKSLGNLQNLETLDITDTLVFKLPSSIAQLPRLCDLRAGLRLDGNVTIRMAFKEARCEGVHYILSSLIFLYLGWDLSGEFEDEEDPQTQAHKNLVSLVARAVLDGHISWFGPLVPRGVGRLKALRTLATVNVGRGKGVVKEIGKLTQLRKLGVTGLTKTNGEAFCAALAKLNHLESLLVRSPGEQSSLHSLDALSSPPQGLKTLKLYGRIDKLPGWIARLESLSKLFLQSTELGDDVAMQELGKLPSLAHLRLWARSVVRTKTPGDHPETGAGGADDHSHDLELCFPKETFPQLVVLEIWGLKELVSMTFEEKAMPKLERLLVRDCKFLRDDGLSSGLHHLDSLKEVEVIAPSGSQELVCQLQMQVAEHPNHPSKAAGDSNDEETTTVTGRWGLVRSMT